METNAQLVSFITTLIIGLMLGSVFDFYRIMRGIFRPKMLMTMIFDGVYWLIALIITFACLIYSNWAQMRFYIFIGIICGWAFYYKFVSKYIVFALLKIIRFIIMVNLYIKTIIINWFLRPIGYFFGIFLLPFRYCERKMKNIKINIKKRLKYSKKMTKK